ncbi:MAG: TIR domain-containing protein, partial [Actinobacteria bacterium]|nr:TIR domain-containing protein [Actinomycetota bacterium]
MTVQGIPGYDAFISYSHALDGALAPALQRGLEQFAKPWYRPRALRVFRDNASLAANPGLWSSIEDALASSTWLVLMASPEAARSPWVNREVEWWRENKSPQRLLVVLTEGKFAWADAGDVDETTAALPPALRGAFAEHPRWVDLRWLRDVDQVDQSNPRLRECVADLAAAIHEVPKDVLVGEHIRQHRRIVQLTRSVVVTLSVLLVVAVVAAVVAVNGRNQAVTAQHSAIARGMMAQAERIRDGDPQGALQLGVAAHELDPRPLTQASLTQSLLSSRYRGALAGHTGAVLSMAFSPEGQTLVTVDEGMVLVWDLTDRSNPRRLGAPLTGHTKPVVFSPDGRT